MNPPEYRIQNIQDFLAVPADKRGACLRDFAHWLSMTDRQNEINAGLVQMFGLPHGTAPLVLDSFVWLDDGIEGISSIAIVTEKP